VVLIWRGAADTGIPDSLLERIIRKTQESSRNKARNLERGNKGPLKRENHFLKRYFG
jgi:hypothetical protein